MHKLLQRQLERARCGSGPWPAPWQALIEAVDEAYQQADADRAMLERSLELTSQELVQRNAELRRDILERRESEEALRESEQRLRRQQATLVELARQQVVDQEQLAAVFQVFTEAAARTLEVERVSVWLFNPERTAIRCQDLYEWSVGRHSDGLELAAAEHPTYFRAIEENRVISAHEAQTDPVTREFSASYLVPLGITSMLDAPIRAGGRTVGVVCHEHVGPPRRWSSEDQGFAGSIADFVSLAIEAAERRRAESAVQRHAEELARSNAELQQFAYVASHDLQEPLRMVASYTELLAQRYADRLDQDAEEFIQYIIGGVTRMQALIDDLLAYSRVGMKGKAFQRTDCNAVLDAVLANLRPAIQEHRAAVTREELPTVLADASQLGQLFQNLVGNAIKFHAEEPPRIHVSAAREGGAWRFSVRDNGIGIASRHFERIFVIFQRLHTSAEYPGTGIGLAICKKIVERHRGRIWVESEPGRGATFHFTLATAGSNGEAT